jgi:predicted nucleotidyltransferase
MDSEEIVREGMRDLLISESEIENRNSIDGMFPMCYDNIVQFAGDWRRLGMKYHLEKKVEDDIIKIAKKNNIEKVILFGSRARKNNSERSDIDLAVSGGDALNFYYDAEEEVRTLLMFDVVDLNREISKELQQEIDRDGIVLYEKI